MHELPVMNSILDIVVKHAEKNNVNKVMAIHLRVGSLSDLEDKWMQHYFDYLSKESVADGAKLVIERSPAVMKCRECNTSFEIDLNDKKKIVCTECKSDKCSLESGKEYYIKNMEVI